MGGSVHCSGTGIVMMNLQFCCYYYLFLLRALLPSFGKLLRVLMFKGFYQQVVSILLAIVMRIQDTDLGNYYVLEHDSAPYTSYISPGHGLYLA